LYDAGAPGLVPTGGKVSDNAQTWSVSFMPIASLLLAGLVALYFGAEWLVRGGAP
jgi:hypothetical protein